MGGQQDPQTTYRSTTFKVVKWCVVALVVLNVLSSIWVGIFMTNKISSLKSMSEKRFIDPGRHIDRDYLRRAEVWRGVIITVLVLTDIASIVGIFGAIRENYCLTMVFGVLMLTYAIFSAASDFTRGSISAWLVSFTAGIMSCMFGHKIRVEVIHPTIYSTPVHD